MAFLQWVVCMEAHADLHSESFANLNYYHFHMAMKLEKKRLVGTG